MASSFKNSNARLSVITDAFSRLQLQRRGSSVVSQQPIQLRSITQTRPDLLKDQTGAKLYTEVLDQRQKRDHTHDQSWTKNPKDDSLTFPQVPVLPLPSQINPTGWKNIRTQRKSLPSPALWKEEENVELLRLAKECKSVYDIYENHFQHRSLKAIAVRLSYATKIERIFQYQADGAARSRGVEDSSVVDKVMAESGASLRRLYKAFKMARSEKRNADQSDDAIQRPVFSRAVKERKGKWTPQEDALLERLMQAHLHVPQPVIWTKVSGGSINGSRLLRDPKACARRWRVLHPSTSFRTGAWTKEEELCFQEAISEQLGGKYQVVVDALVGKPPATENPLGKWRPDLQQLPNQAGLPILKQGSRRLRMLSWVAVAEKVKSRDELRCRDHFYGSYHNGAKGRWTEEELKRAKEGVEMFGNDYWKVAEHVGTRAPSQVNSVVQYWKWAKEEEADPVPFFKKNSVCG